MTDQIKIQEDINRDRKDKLQLHMDYTELNESITNKVDCSNDSGVDNLRPTVEQQEGYMYQVISPHKIYIPTVVLEKQLVDIKDELVVTKRNFEVEKEKLLENFHDLKKKNKILTGSSSRLKEQYDDLRILHNDLNKMFNQNCIPKVSDIKNTAVKLSKSETELVEKISALESSVFSKLDKIKNTNRLILDNVRSDVPKIDKILKNVKLETKNVVDNSVDIFFTPLISSIDMIKSNVVKGETSKKGKTTSPKKPRSENKGKSIIVDIIRKPKVIKKPIALTDKVFFPVSDKRYEECLKAKVIKNKKVVNAKVDKIVLDKKKHASFKLDNVIKTDKVVHVKTDNFVTIMKVVNKDINRAVRKLNDYSVFDFANADFHDYELFECINSKLRTPVQKWIVKCSDKVGPILKWVPKSS